MNDGDLLEGFHRQHPSKVFLRSLPIGSTVLDIGAGDGGLSTFRKWPSPARPDLRLHAFSLEKGALFDEYDSYELGDWNVTKPSFDGKLFDAIMCVNFIEHIDDPAELIRWISSRLKPGGHVYIEWPTDASRFCPTLSDLHAMGFGCVIGNYFDDPTHRKRLPSTRVVKRHIRRRGLAIHASGVISMPLMETELLGHFRATGDLVSLQFAYWLKTGWIQYLTASTADHVVASGTFLQRLKLAVRRPPDQGEIAERIRSRGAV